ncbi:hypothetical protein AA0114_g1880 [Alternaria tenuissima]|uniref:Carboxylesterase type B domain-containing protein n=1 Tax=Alternaria tenuissima TaxID=119927 RepID=A0A4Q4MUZ1_9PLEO|nr:hypothetical protein AA0114_g1880 [Alternaria tenuissima]
MSEEELKKSLGTIRQSPGPQYESLFGNLAMYQGDIIFDATRHYTTEVWGQYGVPVHSYRFSVVPNGIDPEILGVPHFQEIPFVFRNFDGVGHEVNRLASASFKPRQKYLQVSNLMSRMWISFVNEHSPNGHDVENFNVTWPTYKPGNAVNMLFAIDKTKLEQDTYRTDAIRYIIESFGDLRV